LLSDTTSILGLTRDEEPPPALLLLLLPSPPIFAKGHDLEWLVLAALDSMPPSRSSRLCMAFASASPDKKRDECDRGLAAGEPLLGAMPQTEMKNK